MFGKKFVTTGLFVSLVCILSVLGMGAYMPQSCFGGDEEKCDFEDLNYRCSSGKIQVCEDPGRWKTVDECVSGECLNDFVCRPIPCVENGDCPVDYFCSGLNACEQDGTCNDKADCLNPANNWSCSDPEWCQKDDNYTYCETATEIAFCTGCVCG